MTRPAEETKGREGRRPAGGVTRKKEHGGREGCLDTRPGGWAAEEASALPVSDEGEGIRQNEGIAWPGITQCSELRWAPPVRFSAPCKAPGHITPPRVRRQLEEVVRRKAAMTIMLHY